jgi:GMP synthase (glutamine-hydrolysing)
MNTLLIDCVESAADWPEEQVLEDWFGPLLASLADYRPGLSAIAASRPECAARALEADAVILTGSPRDAHSMEPAILQLCDLLRLLTERNIPILGVCFGHQILARALGGAVGRNPSGWEVGNAQVNLTDCALRIPIFSGLPPQLDVLQSHQDAVLELPPAAIHLAGNAHTTTQAFQSHAGGKQFGVQFHPEFTPERLCRNWVERRERLRGTTDFDLDAALDQAQPTPAAATILRRFLDFALNNS